MAVSLGPKARLISAWGIAPGIVTPPNLSRAPTARFIAFDKYLLGGAMSCSGNLARAFSPHLVFQFVTWSVYVFSVIAARAKERGLQSAGTLVSEAAREMVPHPFVPPPRRAGLIGRQK